VTRIELERFESPLGTLSLYCRDAALVALEFDAPPGQTRERLLRRFPDAGFVECAGTPAAAALRRYFHGELDALTGLAADAGGTAFQARVWDALRDIAPGHTLSYGALARRLGQPRAVRAVGLANGQNPVAVVIPCHRVIGTDGSLVGYGGGLERKRWLLAHEGALPAEQRPLFA
jgi:methylated-DNA-[protein]-cysteine S-methyltransferase